MTSELERLLWAVVRGEMPREVLADYMGDQGHPVEGQLREPLQPRLFIVIDIPGKEGAPVQVVTTREGGQCVTAFTVLPDPVGGGLTFRWQPDPDAVLAFGERQLEDVTFSLLIIPR